MDRPSPLFLSRRRLIQMGAQSVGALSLGGAAGMLDTGCARVPAGTTNGQVLMNVQFQVQGALASGSVTSPYYYLAVINLTNNANDPGPVPIVGTPIGNGIAAPAGATSTSTTNPYQTFVGFIQYDTGSQNYILYTCPTTGTGTSAVYQSAVLVPGPTSFEYNGPPDQSVLPSSGATNTFNATVDLNRLKPYSTDTLPQYVQVNVITYSYLASGAGYNGNHYWDAIGSGSRGIGDYAVLNTAQSGQPQTSANFVNPQGPVENQYGQAVTSATDGIIANLYITSWSVVIQS